MNFEIRGVGFVNKGAELMLHAILQQIREWDTGHIVGVNLKTGNHSQRSKVGLYNIPWAEYKKAPYLGEILSRISQHFPKEVLLKYRIIPYSDIDVILDSSGFAYSDQWGTDSISDLLRLTNKWRAAGKKIIFLPQAFGPFEIQKNRLNMMAVIENAELIYARDLNSYDNLIKLENNPSKIKISPDFTNLIEGIVPDNYSQDKKLAYLVPNSRMVDKSTSLSQERYLKFFQTIAKYLIKLGYEVDFLVHEVNDKRLAEQLLSLVGSPSKLLLENNPLLIKGLLGNCSIVIGSRYHSLVSSLSQGIPTIGTSWSHKYQALFEDYSCPECLIANIETVDDLESRLMPLLLDPNRSNLIDRLELAAQEQKKLTENMWGDIYYHLIHKN